jgi:uncharacterized protein
MDIKRCASLCVFALLGSTAHAASFDCKNVSDNIEKIICNSKSLSDLDSRLAETYQKVYAASDSATKTKLLSNQRAWLHHVRFVCGDEECITISYEARIDQLEDLSNEYTSVGQAENLTNLNFEGLQVGEVLDEAAARKIIHNFECGGDKQLEKSLSAFEHQAVRVCRGDAIFEGQQMDAIIQLHSDRRLVSVMLTYDTPYPDEGVNTISATDLENRMIRTYGEPSILRTESLHQPVQYDPADLVEMTVARDQGGDQWFFANGASIVLEPGIGHQKEMGGHIFSSEVIWFNSDAQGVLVTLPAHHPIPVVLTKLVGNAAQWKPDELMTVMLFVGGKRTCTVGRPTPSVTEGGRTRYMTTLSCKDFTQIQDFAVNPLNSTQVHIMRGNQELAEGYIPTVKAVTSLEQH